MKKIFTLLTELFLFSSCFANTQINVFPTGELNLPGNVLYGSTKIFSSQYTEHSYFGPVILKSRTVSGSYSEPMASLNSFVSDDAGHSNSINTSPSISINLANPYYLCNGTTPIITASVIGCTGTFTYQWYLNGSPISSEINSSYLLQHSGVYNCLVNTPCGNILSDSLHVYSPGTPSSITLTSGPTTFCKGSSCTLNAFCPTATVSYRWYVNAGLDSSATGTSYTATYAAGYYCVASNQCGQTNSNVIYTRVIEPPSSYTTVIGSYDLCPNQSTILKTDTNSTNTFSWYKDGVLLANSYTSSIIVTTAGSYKVVKSNSCFTTTTFPIAISSTQLPVASVTPVGNVSLCQGQTLQIQDAYVTYPTFYKWYFNGNLMPNTYSNNIATNNPGTYYCIAYNNCGSSQSPNINFSFKPNAASVISTTDPALLCNGSSSTLTNSDITTNSFQWYKDGSAIANANSSSLSVNAAGNYTCVTTNSCGSSTSNVITITTSQTPVVSIGSVNGNTLCSGQSLPISASTTGNANLQWYLNNSIITSETNATYNATVGGTYTCSATNACGTTMSSPLLISSLSPPTVNINSGSAITICQGQSITLTTSSQFASGFQWYADGMAIQGATNSTLSTSTAGNYICIATNTCGSSASNAVQISTLNLPSISISSSGANTLCSGQTVTLTANAPSGTSLQWMKNSSPIANEVTNTIVTGAAGIYQCSSTNGCGSSVSNSITLAVNPLPQISITSSSASICNFSSVTLSAVSNGGYQWYKNNLLIQGASASTYTTASAGTYKCRATNSCGTTYSNNITLVSSATPARPTGITGNSKACRNSYCTYSTPLVAGATFYNWTVPAGATITAGAGTATITIYFSSTFNSGNVSVAASNSCGTSSLRIKFISLKTTCTARLNDYKEEKVSSFQIFPNPCSGKFNLSFYEENHPGKSHLSITNLLGQTVMEMEISDSEKELTINTPEKAGIYILIIQNSDGSIESKRLIVN